MPATRAPLRQAPIRAAPRTRKGAAPVERGRERVPHAKRAYDELRRRILDNELAAGTQLLEAELAAMLRMSRTPVREAIIQLARDGMVEVRPRHGMRVLPVSAEDMREIYEILTSLEAMAAEIAARRGATDDELARLEDALNMMDAALKRDDLIAWAEADERFHRQLVELSHNKRLINLVDTYWAQSHRVRMLTLKLRPKPVDSNKDHAAVVDAIRRRNSASAARIHHEHRERSGRMLIELLRSHGLVQL